MKRTLALALSILGLAAVAGCTPEQLRTVERVYNVDLTPAQERRMIAAPNVRVSGPTGWINADGSVTRYVAPSWSRCPQHFGAAMQAGWSENDWYRLDPIIYRESRCQPGAHNPHGLDNSYGLMQLNMKAHARWVAPIVDGDFTRLWNPVTNLIVARVLFAKAQDAYGCGWQPWAMRC